MSLVKTFYRFSFILILTVFYSCKKDVIEKPNEQVEALTKITATNSDKSFVKSNGDVLFPWGFNYTNPKQVGLIEDNWDKENTWQIIEEDFKEMKGYGANIVRIHLQYHRFMLDVDNADLVAIERLKRLVKIAEVNNLYLDVTGLGSYRKSDVPQWYSDLDDNERQASQAVFWKNIASAIGDSEAIFAFNLMNEPVVSVGCENGSPCDWLPGNDFGGYHFVQNITRTPGLVFNDEMKNWIERLTTAIRTEDKITMITVGFLALGSVNQFEEDLDYVSIHIYPKSGEIQNSVDKVRLNQGNRPLVLEEISNLNCSIEELENFLSLIDGQYDGLMGHYFGETLEELNGADDIASALHADFLEFFEANNPN